MLAGLAHGSESAGAWLSLMASVYIWDTSYPVHVVPLFSRLAQLVLIKEAGVQERQQ